MKSRKITFHGKRKPIKHIHKNSFRDICIRVAINHGKTAISLNYIIVDDENLLQINQDHLQHNYYTDIITFDLSNNNSEIDGEIYISADRVFENALQMQTQESEMLRVLFHGLLHLLGHKDKTIEEQKEMRRMEDHCINLYLEKSA